MSLRHAWQRDMLPFCPYFRETAHRKPIFAKRANQENPAPLYNFYAKSRKLPISPFCAKLATEMKSQKISSRENRDFRETPLLVVANSRFSWKNHFWPLVAVSKIDPATAAKKSRKNLHSEEFSLQKIFRPAFGYRSKNQHPTELKPPQKRAIFWPFLRPKLQQEVDFWPKLRKITKNVTKKAKKPLPPPSCYGPT